MFAAVVHFEQHGSIGPAGEEDEVEDDEGFSTVTAAAEDPKPSSTTTSPATTDAQRLELDRMLGFSTVEEEEEEADEESRVLGFSTVTASAADPEPPSTTTSLATSSTATSPATTDAQRLELERRIGLLDLEISDLNLKSSRDSISSPIFILHRTSAPPVHYDFFFC